MVEVLAVRYGVMISARSRTKLKDEQELIYFSFSFLPSNDIRNENVA
jgi:hypothetical protein